MKSITYILIILTSLICITTSNAQVSQSDAMRKAVEERRKKAEEARRNNQEAGKTTDTTPTGGASSTPTAGSSGTEGGETTINYSSGRMYSQLISFRYDPSDRDPFISSEVTSPFVTSANPEEEYALPPDDTARIQQAVEMIEDTLKNALRGQLSGVSSARIGFGYSMTKMGDVLRSGDIIPFDLQDQATRIMEAREMSASSGKNLEIAMNGTSIDLEVQRVEGYNVYFYTPGDRTRTFPVMYEMMIEPDGVPPKSSIKQQYKDNRPLPPPM